MRTIAASLLALLTLCHAEEPKVEMKLSFRIPQEKSGGISHTPSVVFTKDGKRMLTATSGGQVVVFDVKTRKLLKELKLPEPGTDAIAIDASGRFVAWVLKGGGVAVLEIGSGEVTARDPALKATWLAISPDATHVALTHGPSVAVHELATLKAVGEPRTGKGDVTNIAWSPDGKRIAWTCMDGHVVVREPGQGEIFTTKAKMPMHAIAFSPDGGRVAYGGQDNTVHQVDLASGKTAVLAKGQPYWITCLGYSPDGTLIAVGDESCDIWLFDVATKERKFHNKHHVECWLSSVAWAPDNETFLFGCRPNSHAGRPHLHAVLTRAEAARSDASRASRARLLAAVDGVIAKTKDEKAKKELTLYRDTLAKEEEVQFAFALSQSYGFNAGGGMFGGAGGGAGGSDEALEMESVEVTKLPSAPSPVQLPESLRKLAGEHGKTLDAEMKKLKCDFCVNQWKVKR